MQLLVLPTSKYLCARHGRIKDSTVFDVRLRMQYQYAAYEYGREPAKRYPYHGNAVEYIHRVSAAVIYGNERRRRGWWLFAGWMLIAGSTDALLRICTTGSSLLFR